MKKKKLDGDEPKGIAVVVNTSYRDYLRNKFLRVGVLVILVLPLGILVINRGWLHKDSTQAKLSKADIADKHPSPAVSADAVKPPSASDIASSDNARASQVSIYLADGNTQAVIDMYNGLINQASDPKQAAQLRTERVTSLFPDYLQQYKQLLLGDAVEADKVLATDVSARLVHDVAEKLGDQATAAKYLQLYQERTDKNARPE